MLASVHASQCSNALNDTSGVNINVNFGNTTGEESNKQITQVYNINSPREQGCKGDKHLFINVIAKIFMSLFLCSSMPYR